MINRFFLTLSLVALLLAGCQPQPATPNPNIVMTAAFETAMAQISNPTETPAPVPTETPIPTATIPRTPPALPPVFTTSALNPLDTPHTYIQDFVSVPQSQMGPE